MGWGGSKPEVPKGPRGLFALESWSFEILCCDPNGSKAFLRILSAKGRGVGLSLEKAKRKGPDGTFIKALIALTAPEAIGDRPEDVCREPSALEG